MPAPQWWQDAICYQIYPRSFADSNADGIGDLPGIIGKLDYLRDLGVNALWISPFYPSPNLDWGYDVSDYHAVAPEYGTLADVDRLIAEAHRRGMRILLDLVLNHTSDQHAWFQHSRSSRANPYRDWYIWRDGRNGGPPNDWESLFGGSAWQYDPATDQYYYHFFFAAQPDLNWRNPAVRAAVAATMRFWLDRGVDGFRLDAISHILERADLADSGVAETIEDLFFRFHSNLIESDWPIIDHKLRHQQHLAENHPLLSEMRTLVDGYGERVLLGETHEPAYYGDGADELHSVFNFNLVHVKEFTAPALRAALIRRQAELPPGAWDCTTVGNHDRTRSASFFADGAHDEARARLALALVMLLPGTPVFYNGEEIGMRDLPPATPADLRDGLALWAYETLKRRPGITPELAFTIAAREIGRDACRTPMQWADAPNAGFTPAGVQPWLPVHPNYATGVNVAAQQAQEQSTLAYFRRLAQLRHAHRALRSSGILFHGDHPAVLAFSRGNDPAACLVLANIGATAVRYPLPASAGDLVFHEGAVQPNGPEVALGPYAVGVFTNA